MISAERGPCYPRDMRKKQQEIIFVTTNRKKLTSLARVLRGQGITVRLISHLRIPESRRGTVRAIARKKAMAAYKRLKEPVIVHDAGLDIRALLGWPGAGLKQALARSGTSGILRRLANCRGSRYGRRCVMTDVIAYCDARTVARPILFERRELGRIAPEPFGDASVHKSVLATLFIPAGKRKTLAAMSAVEFEAYRRRPSMEAHYLALARYLRGRLK